MGASASRGSFAIRASSGDLNLSDGCKGAPVPDGVKLPIMCGEEVMAQKAHGTTETPVQENLRWNCEWKTADKICPSTATTPSTRGTGRPPTPRRGGPRGGDDVL